MKTRSPESIKVVHIVSSMRTGGLEALVLEICRYLQEQQPNVEAEVWGLYPGDDLADRKEYLSVKKRVVFEREQRGPLLIPRLVTMLRSAKPDVVHLHNYQAHLYGGLSARVAGIKAVVTTKHGAVWPVHALGQAFTNASWLLAHRVIAVSQDVERGMARAYPASKNILAVIENGVDTEKYRPVPGDLLESEKRRMFGEGPIIGSVGRLSPEKGFSTLLRAFSEVLAVLPSAKLVVVGDGPERTHCTELSKSLGIQGSVVFFGVSSKLAEIYPLFDLYVQPSNTEGISLTLLEASACGLPIIATNVGGNPEIVVNGVTGRLVPPGNGSVMAAEIIELLADTTAGRSMGAQARQRVIDKFSLRSACDRYVDLYKQLAARHRKNREVA